MARMNRPAPVEITYKNMRFLITHNPTNATLNKFIEVRPHSSSDLPHVKSAASCVSLLLCCWIGAVEAIWVGVGWIRSWLVDGILLINSSMSRFIHSVTERVGWKGPLRLSSSNTPGMGRETSQ